MTEEERLLRLEMNNENTSKILEELKEELKKQTEILSRSMLLTHQINELTVSFNKVENSLDILKASLMKYDVANQKVIDLSERVAKLEDNQKKAIFAVVSSLGAGAIFLLDLYLK